MTNVPPKMAPGGAQIFTALIMIWVKRTWQWQEVREENFHDYEKFGTIVFE
jgi:hypothetical protein